MVASALASHSKSSTKDAMRHVSLAFAALTLIAAAPPPISAKRIKADVATLASDDFAGRGPGEDGEAKTIAFLKTAMAKAGLNPVVAGCKRCRSYGSTGCRVLR
jgi:hypothetical protein